MTVRVRGEWSTKRVEERESNSWRIQIGERCQSPFLQCKPCGHSVARILHSTSRNLRSVRGRVSFHLPWRWRQHFIPPPWQNIHERERESQRDIAAKIIFQTAEVYTVVQYEWGREMQLIQSPSDTKSDYSQEDSARNPFTFCFCSI